MNLSKALTWNELADIYDKSTGGRARTHQIFKIFDWAARQTDKFFVSENGTIHKKEVT